VWIPLLDHLKATTPAVSHLLVQQILDVLVETAPRFAPDADAERAREVASYRWTQGTWLLHLWAELGDEEERAAIMKRLARELVHSDDV
jgi:hypothetical protein